MLDFAFTGVIASKIDFCNYNDNFMFLLADLVDALVAIIKGKQKNENKTKQKIQNENNVSLLFLLLFTSDQMS